MSEEFPHPDRDSIPEAVAEPHRRHSLQLVWIVPIVAALIGASLAVKSYLSRGPVITISFHSGEGIEAGKTKIKYKDVQIGEVKSVVLGKDRSHVVVSAEMTKEAKDLLVKDTLFWVERPRISGGNISGLSTLVGGSYIGMAAGTSKDRQHAFTGRETPVVLVDGPGRQYLLHSRDLGSLDISSPIYYRRIKVGQVVGYDLDKDGKGVTVKAFVRSPYDSFVTANSVFWQESGIDLSLDVSGLKLNTQSVASMLLGGISFQSPEDAPAQPAPPNSTFTLAVNRAEALKRPERVVEKYLLVFGESVRGLALGAPVDLLGVTVGEVTKINLELDPQRKRFSMPVEVQFYPERLRAHYRHKAQGLPADHRVLLDELVAHGFRAQLRNANLLTGQMYVALSFFPDAPKAKIDWTESPPQFPTVPGSLERLQGKIMRIVDKIEKIPFEAVAGDARKTLKSLDATLKSADRLVKQIDSSVVPEARGVLSDARRTLGEARQTLAGASNVMSSDAPVQQDLRETLREVARAAQSLRALADYLERHPESLIRGKKEKE
ncbi:MlaD family protein [Geomonas sp. RF6]|uniref:PqiB family protein n=1 Tax=Geomonas sp. RF6 TaxID=2897342 RepID=UPI001E4A0157|nr:MlaD family protein [Geomonas sp. RF6]UFS70803.1 MlaD family protein [Geomonas sp. RF6]